MLDILGAERCSEYLQKFSAHEVVFQVFSDPAVRIYTDINTQILFLCT